MTLDPTLVTSVDLLPIDVDDTFPDLGPGDARKLHQQNHDTLHAFAQAVVDELATFDLSGKADLVGGFVPDAQIPAGITRDSELTAALVEKADLVAGFVPDAQIPAGITRDSELTAAISAIINGAPALLDTLDELAASIGDDPSFAATVTAALAAKAPTANPVFTGTVGIPDGALAIADTSGLQAALDLKAAITYVDAADALLRTTVATNVQTGTTYTLVLADAGKDVRMGNASASTLTVPPNSSVAFPADTVLGVIQYGAGQVTVTAGAGVTLRHPDGPKTEKQYAAVTLKKLGTDEWLVLGGVA